MLGGAKITVPPPRNAPNDWFCSGLIYIPPFTQPMKCGCVTQPAFRFGSGAVKGTLYSKGCCLPRSAALCPVLLRPQKQSTAVMSFQICLAVGTGPGMRASRGGTSLSPRSLCLGGWQRLLSTEFTGAKLVVVSEGFPELC